MITHLQLKSSSSTGQPALGLPLKPSITIFVGPNNSGKSQLLREILNFCTTGTSQSFILDRLEFAGVGSETAAADLERISRLPSPGEPGLHHPQTLSSRRAIQTEHSIRR